VARPTVHSESHVQRQVDTEAPDLQPPEARIDVLAISVISCPDQALHLEARWEFHQDGLPVPGHLTPAGLDGEVVVLHEGTSHCQCLDDRRAAQLAARCIPGLDADTGAPHDPEVAVVQHPDVRLPVEDKDVRVTPQHAAALRLFASARRHGSGAHVRAAGLGNGALLMEQSPMELRYLSASQQAMVLVRGQPSD